MSQSQTNNSLKASSTGLPHSSTGLPHSSTGLPGTDSLHRRTSSLRGRTNSSSRRKDDSLGRRGAKSPHRGEPSQNWVYEDSSGYFRYWYVLNIQYYGQIAVEWMITQHMTKSASIFPLLDAYLQILHLRMFVKSTSATVNIQSFC